MGTLFRIKLYAESEAQAQAGFRRAFARVAELDIMLSDYRPESELSKATRTSSRQAVPVSHDLFRILSASQTIAQQSGGAFDVTLGPLTHLWREARKQGAIPEPSAIQDALERCGFRKLHLDGASQSVTVDRTGMQLDAGGIAKGYAADEAIAALRAAGISRALVAASGDLAFSDGPPGKPGWRVGIDSFDDAGQPFTRILVLANAAVSTSGDTQQHLDAEGKRYSHILDPRTGMALTNQLTITIVASTGMEADAATKVVSILDQANGLAFVDSRPGMSALIVDRSQHPAVLTSSRRFDTLPSLKTD